MIGLVACLGFVAGTVGFFLEMDNVIEFMQQVSFFMGGATVLLGARKWAGKGKNNDVSVYDKESQRG